MKRYKNIIPVLTICFLIFNLFYYSHHDIVKVNIMNKSIEYTNNEDSIVGRYLIQTDLGVFENVNDILDMKFSSISLQNSLIIGQSYSIEVTNRDLDIIFSYENMIRIVED